MYMIEIVRLHGVPVSIVSDRDALSHQKGLQLALGTRLDFSTAFHPQIDGQTKRLNQILEDMVQACVLEFSRSWDFHFHLMEFAYNNSYLATIGMAPFEALYGRCCRSPVCWGVVGEQRMLGPKDLKFDVGDMVFLKVAPMKGVLRYKKKGKLSAFFHDVFHVSMLRKYVTDPQIKKNLSYEEQPVDILARRLRYFVVEGLHWSSYNSRITYVVASSTALFSASPSPFAASLCPAAVNEPHRSLIIDQVDHPSAAKLRLSVVNFALVRAISARADCLQQACCRAV
ncbi:pol protein [Cucumis melo var. makuwa]|uniref:Pol protein n=1 Tax=Cucumis melo var. makuwa TaxID=1194695 RepID=A0A5A7SYY8_CUCMM|nr:pol protein [Cucumis melo var. makuwa]